MNVVDLVKCHNGFESFNPMQEKAIDSGLLDKNLVVSSPTASGKTVVAELAALQSVLVGGKKVIYTCPLRALASEHYADFRRKYSEALGIKCVLSTGDFDSSGKHLSSKDIIFTTFEKLNSLLNHNADWLSQIGLLVVDEIHSLGSDRGVALEMVITKLRFLNRGMKTLGLSATIPNAKEISGWLKAGLVESDYRPVVLKEGVFFDGSIDFLDSTEKIGSEGEAVVAIARNTLEKGKQALVFANTRKSSEANARKLAKIAFPKLTASEKIELEKASNKILNVLEQPTEQCRTLSGLVREGACFHNAGLLQRQREVIEELFKKNYLKFIASTPTLAAGVNLPAYRVVMVSPYRYTGYGMDRIPVSEFKQMSGRAGRPKYDSEGQAILIAKTEFEKDDYMDYFIKGEVEDVKSRLASESALRFHLLSVISTGFVFDLDSADRFFSETFYARQFGSASSLFTKITKLVSELEAMGFVKTSEKRIDATPLGRRVTELYLDPVSAFKIINALRKERFNDLAYLFTISDTMEFFPLLRVSGKKEAELWEKLQEEKVNLAVDVDKEMFSDNDILDKYWTALMLGDWVSEVKEQSIVDTFRIQPGILRAKLQNADWLSYSALELAKILSLDTHFMPLNKMRKRLKSGIKEELVPLCELRGIGRVRARRLFNAGIRTVADVKKTDVRDLEKVLTPKIAVSVKRQLSLRK